MYGAGAAYLKGGGASTFFYLDISFFLHLEITLPKLRYAFEEKFFFSATTILGKKVILSCLKMNLNISHKLR